MKLIGFFWGLISLLSVSAIANPSQYESYNDNYMDFSITIGDTINGVTQVSCVNMCIISGVFPGGATLVCDSGTDVCVRVAGSITTTNNNGNGNSGNGNSGNGNSGNGNSGNGNSGNSNTGNSGPSAPTNP